MPWNDAESAAQSLGPVFHDVYTEAFAAFSGTISLPVVFDYESNEFTLTFSRVDHEVEDDEVPGVVVTRVSLAPQAMRELIDAMEDNWSKWRTREGIKRLPEIGDF